MHDKIQKMLVATIRVLWSLMFILPIFWLVPSSYYLAVGLAVSILVVGVNLLLRPGAAPARVLAGTFKVMQPIVNVLVFLVPNVLVFMIPIVAAVWFVPPYILLTVALTLSILTVAIILAIRVGIISKERAYDLSGKGLRLASLVFLAPIILIAVAVLLPVAYAMLLASVLWSVFAYTPIIVAFCTIRAACVFFIYLVPDVIYSNLFSDRRIEEWVEQRVDQRNGQVSDSEMLQFVLEASVLFAPRLSDAPALAEKVARNVARRRKRKLHIIRRFPAWWELFRYVLPKNVETQVFDPTYNDLLADYLSASHHFKHGGRRKWLTFCFGFRTIVMFLECLRVFVTDRTIGHLTRLGPHFLKSAWKALIAD